MTTNPKRLLGAATALGLTLAISACAEEGGGKDDSATGDGVAYGAPLEDWKAAFADVDPITVNAQSSAPEGSPVGKMYEDYFKEVEEWSDGKITFEIAFSNAVAETLEVDDALRDGRLDMGNVLYVYEADQYPFNAALGDASFIGDQAPAINPLQLHGAMNQIALESDQFASELEEQGLVPILPWFSGDANGIECSEARSSMADFKGVQTVAAGRVNSLELKALSAAPVSMPYTELFEALQRGTVDCSLNSMRVASLMGLIDISPNFTIDETVGLSKTPGGWLVSKNFWDELPLVAQQLLFDKSRTILDVNITGSTQFQVDGLAAIQEAGGTVSPFSNDAREALEGAHAEALDAMAADSKIEDGAALVSELESKTDGWASKVRDLGFDGEVGFADFSAWHEENGFDLTEYLDTLYDDVVSKHRPS